MAMAPWPANFHPKPSGRDEKSVCAWLLHQENWDFTRWRHLVRDDRDGIEAFDELCVVIAYVADMTPMDIRYIFEKHTNKMFEKGFRLSKVKKVNHKRVLLPNATARAILDDTRSSILQDLKRGQAHRFLATVERWLRQAIVGFLARNHYETQKERKDRNALKKAGRKTTASGPAPSANAPKPMPSNTCTAAEPTADMLHKKGSLESVVHGQSAADAITASSHAKGFEKDEFGDMSMDDFKFLVTCLQNSKNGPISIDTQAVSTALGYRPVSVSNLIYMLRQRLKLPLDSIPIPPTEPVRSNPCKRKDATCIEDEDDGEERATKRTKYEVIILVDDSEDD